MLAEEIKKNYNKLGIEIIETIYTDDYLSIGGTASTEDLAVLAGVTQQSRVLEIGSGVGGLLCTSLRHTAVPLSASISSKQMSRKQTIARRSAATRSSGLFSTGRCA